MVYLEKNFVKEFRSVMVGLRRNSSAQFNLSFLGIEPNGLSEEITTFAKLKGISEQSFFNELNDKKVFISNRKTLNETGKYSFKNASKTLSVPSDCVLVAYNQLVRVPNNYIDTFSKVKYLGIEKSVHTNSPIMYFSVPKKFVYPLKTFVVTISTNNVTKHLGGVSVILTNGQKVNIVIQDRSLIRKANAKSVYAISDSLEDANSKVKLISESLVVNKRAFNPMHFNVTDESTGLTYNLTKKVLDANYDLDEFIADLSISQLEGLDG